MSILVSFHYYLSHCYSIAWDRLSNQFLRASAMLNHVIAIGLTSVRPSARPPVGCCDRSKTTIVQTVLAFYSIRKSPTDLSSTMIWRTSNIRGSKLKTTIVLTFYDSLNLRLVYKFSRSTPRWRMGSIHDSLEPPVGCCDRSPYSTAVLLPALDVCR